jgi:hypothetical protein
MAEEKQEKTKKSSIELFRAKLRTTSNVQETVLEGLKHASGRVRSLALKVAVRTQDQAFVKKNLLPLIESEKSKKVLRALQGKITRKSLDKKVEALKKAKAATAKKADEAAPAEQKPAG